MTVLEAKNIQKYFWVPEKFQALKDISFQMEKGEFVSIMGKSGCGKSTLLYVLVYNGYRLRRRTLAE
jgi:lipoprotein-releasing system ATP-binding protein